MKPIIGKLSLTLAFPTLMAIAAARPAFAQDQACIAHHPLYIENTLEIAYEPGCTGHDEPELFPISNHSGSGRDLTWTVVLPSDSKGLVANLGPAFWFGGPVNDAKSLLGQSFVELQFYPDSIVKNCFPNGAFSVDYAPNAYTACSPVFRVTSSGQSGKFKEPTAFNAMLTDDVAGRSALVMNAGDTIAVHWYTTSAQDGFHVTVTDLTTHHSGTIVLNSGSAGPLMPAYDTQLVGNSLAWGVVNDAPNAFVWEIGHASIYGTEVGAVCVPGDVVCDSYNSASWGAIAPIRIVSVIFGDGSAPQAWGTVSDQGGKAEIEASCSKYGGAYCIYPWYTLSSGGGFHYGIDYPDTKKDYGKADQFSQTTKCSGPFGANSTYCSTIIK